MMGYAALATATSCGGDEPSGTGGTTSTGTGTGAGGATGGSGGGGDPECVTPADCGADTTCRTFVCETDVCGMADAPLGTPCQEDGGEICDGR